MGEVGRSTVVMNEGAPSICSNLRTLQLPPGGRGPGAPPVRASTCWPLAPPTAWTKSCFSDQEPATHRLPGCPRTPAAAAAADRHLRREDSTRAGSSLSAAEREGKGAVRGAYPPRQRTGIQAAAMVVEGAARTWERRRIRGRLPESRGPCVPTTPACRPAEILHPSETQELAPSRSGGDAPTANRAKRRIDVQPGPRWWVQYEDTRAGSNKGETATVSGTCTPAPDRRPGLYT